jgi:hypothetical protein
VDITGKEEGGSEVAQDHDIARAKTLPCELVTFEDYAAKVPNLTYAFPKFFYPISMNSFIE